MSRNNRSVNPMDHVSQDYKDELSATVSLMLVISRRVIARTGKPIDYRQPISRIWRRDLTSSERKEIMQNCGNYLPADGQQARVALLTQSKLRHLKKRNYLGPARWFPGTDERGQSSVEYIIFPAATAEELLNVKPS